MVPGQFTRSTCTEKPSSHGNHLNRFGRRNDWVPYWANASAGILVHQQRFALWPTLLSVAPLVQCVVCRLSSVTFCIATKRYVLAKNCLKERIGNQGQKVDFGGSPSYFYFRFRLYGHRDGRFCLIFAHTAQQSVQDGTNWLSSSKRCAYCRIVRSSVSSVCLSSVTFCIVAKRYVLAKNCLKWRIGNQGQKVYFLGRRHISTSGFASTATETTVFALFLPIQPSDRYWYKWTF